MLRSLEPLDTLNMWSRFVVKAKVPEEKVSKNTLFFDFTWGAP